MRSEGPNSTEAVKLRGTDDGVSETTRLGLPLAAGDGARGPEDGRLRATPSNVARTPAGPRIVVDGTSYPLKGDMTVGVTRRGDCPRPDIDLTGKPGFEWASQVHGLFFASPKQSFVSYIPYGRSGTTLVRDGKLMVLDNLYGLEYMLKDGDRLLFGPGGGVVEVRLAP